MLVIVEMNFFLFSFISANFSFSYNLLFLIFFYMNFSSSSTLFAMRAVIQIHQSFHIFIISLLFFSSLLFAIIFSFAVFCLLPSQCHQKKINTITPLRTTEKKVRLLLSVYRGKLIKCEFRKYDFNLLSGWGSTFDAAMGNSIIVGSQWENFPPRIMICMRGLAVIDRHCESGERKFERKSRTALEENIGKILCEMKILSSLLLFLTQKLRSRILTNNVFQPRIPLLQSSWSKISINLKSIYFITRQTHDTL